MDIIWQQILIGLAVTGAVVYLVKRALRPPEKPSACSKCHCNKKSLLDSGDIRRS